MAANNMTDKSLVEAELNDNKRMGVTPNEIHILICEDDLVTRKIVERLVLKYEYQVTTADDGQAALDMLEADPTKYHILLSDVVMPRMTGLELLRQIRKHEKLRDMPVVMMSAMDESKLAYRCLNEGADDYMFKPIRQEFIQGIWRNVWRKRREALKTRQLEEETRKRMEMESAISSLQNKVSEAIETPLSAIVRTVGDLISNQNVTNEVKDTLGQVLQSLQSSQLYQPALETFIANQDMDTEVKDWFMNQTNATVVSPRHPVFAPKTLTPIDGDEDAVVPKLKQLEFDVWNLDEDGMIGLLAEMFTDLNLLTTFNIEHARMLQWINEVRRSYNDNPYHNFRHAFDVTQMTYFFLTTGKGTDLLTPVDVLSVMIAAVCHDLDHPGVNNVFLMKTHADLAVLYNDKSVLENHHASTCFRILAKPECNILSGLSREEFSEARTAIIKIILATDLAVHVEVLARFEAGIESFNTASFDDRNLLLQLIVKCADISNPLRPWMLAKYWSDMICEEQFRQGDRERDLGFEVLAFMDRQQCDQAKMSVGFIDIFVNPLFSSVCRLLPAIKPIMEKLADNRYRWQSMLEPDLEPPPSGPGDDGPAAPAENNDNDNGDE